MVLYEASSDISYSLMLRFFCAEMRNRSATSRELGIRSAALGSGLM